MGTGLLILLRLSFGYRIVERLQRVPINIDIAQALSYKYPEKT